MSEDKTKTKSKDALQDDTAPEPAAPDFGDDAVLVKADQKVEGVFSDAAGETFVTLTKDVVEEFYFPGTKRPAYRTLFVKGQTVAQSTVDALNANVEARKAASDAAAAGEEPKLEEYVDSTTLASGTGAKR